MNEDRLMIFIDYSNLFHSCKDLGIKLDIEKFLKVVSRGKKLIRPYLFGTEAQNEGQKSFYDVARYLGYTIVLKELKSDGRGKFFEKGVDIAMTTYFLKHGYNNTYDIALLVTGDKDYITAIEAVKEMGKRVEVAGFRHATAKELQLAVDEYIPLDNFIEMIKRV